MDSFNEQVFDMMTRCRNNEQKLGSKTTSTPKDDARVTEIVDGLIITRPVKKEEGIGDEPEIIDLQEYAKHGGAARGGKSGSVNGNVNENKVKVIADFLF